MGNDMSEEDTTPPVYTNVNGVDYDVSAYTLPADRAFRNAWDTPEGNVINVNMEKAKDIWRDEIRLVREDEFAKLDEAFMKALEAGGDTSDIAAQKQNLRDAPAHPDIDAATTPEELKLVQPIPNVTVG